MEKETNGKRHKQTAEERKTRTRSDCWDHLSETSLWIKDTELQNKATLTAQNAFYLLPEWK